MDPKKEQGVGLETPLLTPISSKDGLEIKNGGFNKEAIFAEAKKQLWLAGPLMSVNVLLHLIQTVSVMFVGHVGELPLSGASMATSLASVTGFSFMIGMAGTLETFCGQSYGAKQHQMLGIHAQRAIIVLLMCCIPIACLWASAGHILTILGQNPEIAAEAGLYARFMIPTIFAYALLQCQFRFLQTQNIVLPMVLSVGVSATLHIPICWLLVFKTSLGSKGAALAIGVSYWISDLILALYIKLSPTCQKSWTGFSMEAFHEIPKFLRLGVPSTIMTCAELWSFEIMVILAGLLPDPELETSVLSVSLNTNTMFYMIPVALGSSISVRIANELGAGRPHAAKLAVCVALLVVGAESAVVVLIMILGRKFWGTCYSGDDIVVNSVSNMMFLVAAMHFPDAIQSVLSGIARGCGWQKTGAIVNLGAFYIFGIPSGIMLGFFFHLGGKGLWTGVIVAICAQTLFFSVVTITTKWNKEAEKASARVFDTMIPTETLY